MRRGRDSHVICAGKCHACYPYLCTYAQSRQHSRCRCISTDIASVLRRLASDANHAHAKPAHHA